MRTNVVQSVADNLGRMLFSPGILMIFGLAIAALILGFLLRTLFSDSRPTYVRTQGLLTENELDFVRQLRAVCPREWIICPQVAISALLEVAEHVRDRRAARNCYSQCYADFVLCQGDSYDIVGIVELDDRSHGRPHRRARDERLDAIYKSIGLPVAHVPGRKTGKYTTEDAKKALVAIRGQLP